MTGNNDGQKKILNIYSNPYDYAFVIFVYKSIVKKWKWSNSESDTTEATEHFDGSVSGKQR